MRGQKRQGSGRGLLPEGLSWARAGGLRDAGGEEGPVPALRMQGEGKEPPRIRCLALCWRTYSFNKVPQEQRLA